MLLAVLGHLEEPDRKLLGGLAQAGAAAYAVVVDVSDWSAAGPADQPATASLRGSGWKATTLERDGTLATSWLELVL